MRKDLGVKPAVYPMPVLMIATYDENGGIDIEKSGILMFDQFKAGYYVTGEKAGQAWSSGKELM